MIHVITVYTDFGCYIGALSTDYSVVYLQIIDLDSDVNGVRKYLILKNPQHICVKRQHKQNISTEFLMVT